MIEDYSGFPEWADKILFYVGLITFTVFAGGMIFMFAMFTWFPEWEQKYDKHQEVKRHAELSTRLGRNATMKEYYKSLGNIDISTGTGFVDALSGVKK